VGVGRTFSKRDNALFVNNTFWVNELGFILVDRKTPQKLIQGVGGKVVKLIIPEIRKLELLKRVYK
jgi:hypothetical protein